MSEKSLKFKPKDVYGYKLQYKDDIDLVQKVLSVYATLTNLKDENINLRPRLIQVLSFYMLMGFNKDTKNVVMESLNITSTNLNQINSELGSNGYLVRDGRNLRNYHLSEELNLLKQYFIEDETANAFVIPFKKLVKKR